MRCAPPQNYPFAHTVVDRGYEMFFLDQRGTGLSSPLSASTLQMRGTTDVQAKYRKSRLQHPLRGDSRILRDIVVRFYRAESIVRDCEAIRQALTATYPDNSKKWSIMGQSYGGFCSLTYLSFCKNTNGHPAHIFATIMEFQKSTVY